MRLPQNECRLIDLRERSPLATLTPGAGRPCEADV